MQDLARIYGKPYCLPKRLLGKASTLLPKRRAKLSPLARVQHRTYTLPGTGKRLPYALLVPPGYAHRQGPVPLLLALHGLDYDCDWVFSLPGLVEWACEHGVVVAAPMGYTRDGWYGAPDLIEGRAAGESEKQRRSEEDVMHVLRMVREELTIDADRIFALGWSMGGSGALHIAHRRPGLFAALLLISPAISAPFNGVPSWTRAADVQLEKLAHVPMLVVQGTRDRPVPVAATRQLCEDLASAGVRHVYLEVQGGGHSCAELLPPATLRRVLLTLVSHARRAAGAATLRAPPRAANELRISGSSALVARLLAVRASS